MPGRLARTAASPSDGAHALHGQRTSLARYPGRHERARCGCACSMRRAIACITVRVDRHAATVMAIDGQPAEPFMARDGRVTLAPGQRGSICFVDAALAPGSIAPIFVGSGRPAKRRWRASSTSKRHRRHAAAEISPETAAGKPAPSAHEFRPAPSSSRSRSTIRGTGQRRRRLRPAVVHDRAARNDHARVSRIRPTARMRFICTATMRACSTRWTMDGSRSGSIRSWRRRNGQHASHSSLTTAANG